MYRRLYQNDELLSNVLISMALLLLFGIHLSWKLVGQDNMDVEFYFYAVCAGISFLSMIFFIFIFVRNTRIPFYDIELDFIKEEIRVLNQRITYSFKDVKLYSFNKRHRHVRVLVKRRLIGFAIDTMRDDKNDAITEDIVNQLGMYATTVEPKRLYNYHLMVSIVFSGLYALYMFISAQQPFLFFGTYIPTYYMAIAWLLLVMLTVWLNRIRMKKLYQTNQESTSEN